MECYFAHLPEGLSKLLTVKEPILQLISSKECPHYQRPCSSKAENNCCLGDMQCVYGCPNNHK